MSNDAASPKAKPKPDGRRQRGQQTRQKLLVAALRLIGVRGLDAFSAQALSKEAGVSQSLLYHHFSGLDGLIPGVAELLWDMMERMLGGAQPPTLKGYLERLGRLTMNPTFYSAPFARAGAELYRRSLTDPTLRKLMHKLRQRAAGRLTRDLERYASGPGARARVEDAVELLLPLCDGLAMHLSLFDNRKAAARAWALVVAQVEAHLLKGAAPVRRP